MKTFLVTPAVVASLMFSSAAITPVRAGGGDVAAGLIGGLAAGTIIGVATAGPAYYPPPPPVYVALEPTCYWTRGQPVWATEGSGYTPAFRSASNEAKWNESISWPN